MEIELNGIALAILARAYAVGYLAAGDKLLSAPELAESERETFLRLFRELRRHLDEAGRNELTADELASLFNYVVGKSAEHAYNHYAGQRFAYDVAGMFNGSVALYVDDNVMSFLKNTPIAATLGGAFLDYRAAHPAGDALVALGEGLKWCGRIAAHLTLELLEQMSENGPARA